MGHSRTPTQNTAGDGFPADPIGGTACSAKAAPLRCVTSTRTPGQQAEADVSDGVVLDGLQRERQIAALPEQPARAEPRIIWR